VISKKMQKRSIKKEEIVGSKEAESKPYKKKRTNMIDLKKHMSKL
jgi:hypothetical protein